MLLTTLDWFKQIILIQTEHELIDQLYEWIFESLTTKHRQDGGFYFTVDKLKIREDKLVYMQKESRNKLF